MAWAADHDPTPVEREFLAAGKREQRRDARRLRRLVALLGALVLLAASATGMALSQRGEAQRQRDIAVSQNVANTASNHHADQRSCQIVSVGSGFGVPCSEVDHLETMTLNTKREP
jgi:hypothetical protein